MEKIRWGIIGPGKIAEKFASDIRFTNHAKLCAVASRSIEHAKNFAGKFGISRYYEGYDLLYHDNDIDAVYVATPHPFHFQNSADALRAGKAVLCEKPITMTPDECRQLISIANSTGNYLMEALWTYFLPAIKKAEEWISEGRIGTIKHIKSSFGFNLPYQPEHRAYNPRLGGGSILDIGIYCIAITWLFYKKTPDQVMAMAELTSENVESDTLAILNFDGKKSVIHSSFHCKLPDSAFIIGDQGYIEIPEFWRAKECMLYKDKELMEHFTDIRESNGLNFEIEAASIDILNRKKESEIMKLSTSLVIQEIMESVLNATK